MTSQAHFGFEDAAEETIYKLTDAEGYTRFREKRYIFTGAEGVTHTASGKGTLYESGWIYAYPDPLLAVIFNPNHAQIDKPVLWKCTGRVGLRDGNFAVGCTSLTTLQPMALPQMSVEQRIHFGILCVKQVYQDASWTTWADSWLTGPAHEYHAACEEADAAIEEIDKTFGYCAVWTPEKMAQAAAAVKAREAKWKGVQQAAAEAGKAAYAVWAAADARKKARKESKARKAVPCRELEAAKAATCVASAVRSAVYACMAVGYSGKYSAALEVGKQAAWAGEAAVRASAAACPVDLVTLARQALEES